MTLFTILVVALFAGLAEANCKMFNDNKPMCELKPACYFIPVAGMVGECKACTATTIGDCTNSITFNRCKIEEGTCQAVVPCPTGSPGCACQYVEGEPDNGACYHEACGSEGELCMCNWGWCEFIGPVCLHADTLVDVPGGTKPAQDIYKGDFVIDYRGKPLEVLNSAISGLSQEFIRFEKDSLAPGVPTRTVLMTEGHVIRMPDGHETQAGVVAFTNPKVKKVDVHEKKQVYHLITQNRTFVMASGIETVTWAQGEYEEALGGFYKLQ